MAGNDRVTIYYRPERDGDLKAQIALLQNAEDSKFSGRAESEIARMLLSAKLKEEIKREGLNLEQKEFDV